MSITIRRSVILTPEQFAWLRAEAARLGIKKDELVRRLIDKVRGA